MAEESAAPKEEAKAASGGKPILMYVALLVNVLAMIGMAAIVLTAKKKEDAKPTIDNVIQGEHEAQTEEKEKEVEFIGKTIPLETFLVNLKGARGQKLLKVNMEIELDGEKVLEEIEKRKPQVRDTIIGLLANKNYDDVSTPDGKEQLKSEIRDTVNRFLTKGQIRRILFTEFIYN